MKAVEEGVFDLEKLEIIDLSFNRLKALSPNLLINAPDLKRFNVQSNQLTEFVPLLENLRGQVVIVLKENPNLIALNLTEWCHSRVTTKPKIEHELCL